MTDTTYALVSPFISERFEHPISKRDFDLLNSSRDFIIDYLRFEESILQCKYSFQEYEEFILRSNLHQYLFPLSEYDFYQDTRVRANIRVLSLLNSITSVREHFPRFKKRLGLEDTSKFFVTEWNSQRANSAAFSFFERLRNYAQHQAHPVVSVSTNQGWDKDMKLLESTATVFVDVAEVCSDRRVSSVERIRYLDELGQRADVSLLFRETMGRLGIIVDHVRENISASFDSSTSLIEEFLEIVKKYNENLSVCDVVTIDKDGAKKNFSIFNEFVDRPRRLRRDRLSANGELHIISNRAHGHKHPKKKIR